MSFLVSYREGTVVALVKDSLLLVSCPQESIGFHAAGSFRFIALAYKSTKLTTILLAVGEHRDVRGHVTC
jgi:hypothetical protein